LQKDKKFKDHLGHIENNILKGQTKTLTRISGINHSILKIEYSIEKIAH